MKSLNLVFTGVSSVAALSLAFLAYYVAFFTNLPEVIINQLRVEVSETREQVIDLTRERRGLLLEIESARKELMHIRAQLEGKNIEVSSSASQLEKNKKELINITSEVREVRGDLENIREAKNVYLNNSIKLVSNNLLSIFREKLTEAKRNAEKTRDLGLVKDWLQQQDRIKSEIEDARNRGEYENVFSLIDANHDALPDSWSFTFLLRWLRDSTPSEKRMGLSDHVDVFITNLVENSRGDSVTFRRLFFSAVEETDMSVFLREDKDDFLSKCEKLTRKYEFILNKSSQVRLFSNWDFNDSEREANIVIGDIEKMFQSLEAFGLFLRDSRG
tara:strand:+ start:994 stop:1986 length:993 start_codon:yes stop_codon:yes gene_type:complete